MRKLLNAAVILVFSIDSAQHCSSIGNMHSTCSECFLLRTLVDVRHTSSLNIIINLLSQKSGTQLHVGCFRVLVS